MTEELSRGVRGTKEKEKGAQEIVLSALALVGGVASP